MKTPVCLSLLLALACGENDAQLGPAPSLGGAGGAPATPSEAASGAGSATASGNGGAVTIAGTGGRAGAGVVSAAAGTGGQPMGSAGSSGAGTGGGIGVNQNPDLLTIAAAFERFRWEFPCQGSVFITDAACSYDLTGWQSAGAVVDQSNGLKAELTRSFGGSADAVYAVTLRFRGVVEGNMYKNADGMLDAELTAAPHFHVGGTVHEHFQIYSLVVSQPPQIFYLNAFHDLVKPLAIDYTATIQVGGGATLTFGLADTNTACFSNSEKVVVPEVHPAPEAFNGQFIQADVVSVTAL